MPGFIRKRPILSYSILALLVTYGIGLPWVQLTRDLEHSLGLKEELLSLAFMRFGPTIAGLVVVAVLAGSRGFRVWLRQLLNWRVHPGYYLGVALLVILPFVLAVILVTPPEELKASGDLSGSRDWGAIGGAYLVDAAYRIVTNGEETGWRFVMLSLALVHMRLAPAVLVVAAVWAIWHMPAFFLFGQEALWYPLILICLNWSVLLGWLYVRTRSLLLCLIAHGAANATFYTFEAHFPGLSAGWEARVPLGDWVFSCITLVIALILLVLERRMFFGPAPRNPGADWLDRAADVPPEAGIRS